MNPLINEAANTVQGGWLLGIMTAVFLATFLYWFWYAYAPHNKDRMEAAGRIPFESDASSDASSARPPRPYAEGGDL